MKFVSLIQIDPVANANKFYKMTQIDSATFKAEWGRVGATGQSGTYPMDKWDTKYKEKIKGGYRDNTSATAVIAPTITSSTGTATLAPIINNEVRLLIEKLQKYSAQAVAANYTVTVVKVTQHAVDEAQKLIDDINGILGMNCDINAINRKLIDLWSVIPRKIANVRLAVVQFPIDDATKLDTWKGQMAIEQALLDAMRTQVHAAAATAAASSSAPGTKSVISILDHLGLDIDTVDATTDATLKRLMGSQAYKYIKAFKVTNVKTQAKFDKDLAGMPTKRVEEFFHGSRAENWYSILENGLALRPNAVVTGKLFGHGIYFANDADKSMGYIDGGRWNGNNKIDDAWLAVFSVSIGKPLDLRPSTPTRSDAGSMDYAKLRKLGNYDSLWAHAGYKYSYTGLRKDEIIVYKEEQCTIHYLIQIKM